MYFGRESSFRSLDYRAWRLCNHDHVTIHKHKLSWVAQLIIYQNISLWSVVCVMMYQGKHVLAKSLTWSIIVSIPHTQNASYFIGDKVYLLLCFTTREGMMMDSTLLYPFYKVSLSAELVFLPPDLILYKKSVNFYILLNRST